MARRSRMFREGFGEPVYRGEVFYGRNYSGLDYSFDTDFFSELKEKVWEGISKGGYVEVEGPNGRARLELPEDSEYYDYIDPDDCVVWCDRYGKCTPGEVTLYDAIGVEDAKYESVMSKRKRTRMTEANKGYSSAVYQALDSDFRDGWSGKVDPVYVSDQVELWLMNDKPCYDNIFNTRMKAHSVAYAAMLSLFQDVVDRYDVKVRVTSEMAKQWLKRNGMNYIEVLKPVVSRVEEEREERKSYENESYRRRRRFR